MQGIGEVMGEGCWGRRRRGRTDMVTVASSLSEELNNLEEHRRSAIVGCRDKFFLLLLYHPSCRLLDLAWGWEGEGEERMTGGTRVGEKGERWREEIESEKGRKGRGACRSEKRDRG